MVTLRMQGMHPLHHACNNLGKGGAVALVHLLTEKLETAQIETSDREVPFGA